MKSSTGLALHFMRKGLPRRSWACPVAQRGVLNGEGASATTAPKCTEVQRYSNIYYLTGVLLGPHAPSALLELSYPRSRARRVLKANGKPPASRGAPHRTRVEIRSGWDYASTGHLVCLVQTCVKGPYLYLYLYL